MADPQRTHAATPKRVKEFRKKGDLALSRDAVSAAVFAGGVIALVACVGGAGSAIMSLTRDATLAADGRDPAGLPSAAVRTFGTAVVPVMIGAGVAAVASIALQLGWPPAFKKIGFDFGKLSPVANLGATFSLSAMTRRTGSALVKLIVVGAIVVMAVRGSIATDSFEASGIGAFAWNAVSRVLWVVVGALIAIGVGDYILSRRRMAAKMKMTSEEVKREHRESEGDPMVRGKRRQRMRELAKRRMAQAVAKADVVVVNPSHYAVALRYDDKQDRAPVVVAKGVDESAEKIREIARQHAVPILARPPLARALHKHVKEGQPIPVNLFKAVAEVLAYVYKLREGVVNPKGKSGQWMMVVGLVGILAVAMAPLPPSVFDLLIGVSLFLSALVFLVAFYVEKASEFSSFPSLLLFVTLFRLALNIASTRLILTGDDQHAAGAVIQAFGEFVISGNFVVGAVVFMILVIVNFVVITKGAERISEVSARFTLDSMPGKQMAIDADLGAGLISEKEARARRLAIQRDADFHGSMDGASKFVRGDAVAGLLVLAINVVGGIIIGVAQKKMSFGHAAETYTVLSIGDGLVAQIPALLVSTGAALLTTRSDDAELGRALGGQLFARKRPLKVTAALLVVIGLLPGMPHVLFIGLGVIAALMASKIKEGQTAEEADAPAIKPGDISRPADERAQRGEIEAALPVELLTLEVGLDLLGTVDAARGGELLTRIASLRKQLALELGVIVPPIHIRDDLRMRPGGYRVLLSGVTIAEAEVHVHRVLAIDPTGSALSHLPGETTTEPTFGLPAKWLLQSDRARAEAAGCTVVDAPAVIATHLADLLRRNAHELLGRREAQELLDIAGKHSGKVIEELIPHLMSMGGVMQVLRNLLREGVSVRDLRTILEGLADSAHLTKNPDELTEHVRQRLARRLTRSQLSSDGALRPLVLDPRAEALLRDATGRSARALTKLTEDIAAKARDLAMRDEPPLLVVAPDLRRAVAGIAARHVPGLAVMSFREVDPGVPFVTRGVISAQEAAA